MRVFKTQDSESWTDNGSALDLTGFVESSVDSDDDEIETDEVNFFVAPFSPLKFRILIHCYCRSYAMKLENRLKRFLVTETSRTYEFYWILLNICRRSLT